MSESLKMYTGNLSDIREYQKNPNASHAAVLEKAGKRVLEELQQVQSNLEEWLANNDVKLPGKEDTRHELLIEFGKCFRTVIGYLTPDSKSGVKIEMSAGPSDNPHFEFIESHYLLLSAFLGSMVTPQNTDDASAKKTKQQE